MKLLIVLLALLGISTSTFACAILPPVTPPGCTRTMNMATGCMVLNCPSGFSGHSTQNVVTQVSQVVILDLIDVGGWRYHNDPLDPSYGQIEPNCTHTDLSGKIWDAN